MHIRAMRFLPGSRFWLLSRYFRGCFAHRLDNSNTQKMAHYIPAGLAPSPVPILCALGKCGRAIPMGPLPPAFSLLKAESAMLNPTQRDVRIYFCSGEHRDQYWKQEQGWLDRQVAMPSVRVRVVAMKLY